MLTDSHAHLDFPQLLSDLPCVLSRATAAGITRIVTIGTSVDSTHRALDLAVRHAQIFAAAGIHPNSVAEAPPDYLARLRDFAQNPRLVALGETGLDYHYLPSTRGGTPADDTANKAQQAEFFRHHLDLAAELALPVVIHERDAWADTVAILREYTGRVRAVFHCFGKSPAHAAEVLALGHLVSFTGIVTFKNAGAAAESAAAVPLDRFMVETDSPYLAPIPFRGKPCEPAHTRLTAEHIARLRQIPLETLASATEATANAFFRFP
jgi:TatD DNase family protein